MLSYRHAFHAGNHADVLKHLVEVLILQYLLKKKTKGLRYIDTHAGPGVYALRASFAEKTREFETGVQRLWLRDDLPTALESYMALVRSFNVGSDLSHYPGSPAIAARMLGPAHRLQLFELHPDDADRLRRWKGRDSRIEVQARDGFSAVNGVVPPPEKRGLVMMDPPYEVKTDYTSALDALRLGQRKFATGVYALWYPLLDRVEVTKLVRNLERWPGKFLLVELPVRAAGSEGMYGSGMFVINPPWPLGDQLTDSLPYLHALLAGSNAAPWRIVRRDGSL